MINDTGGHIIGPRIRLALTALLSLIIILAPGITGCTYTAGFNNPVSGISMATDIESEASSSDASKNIITSKVILTPYKGAKRLAAIKPEPGGLKYSPAAEYGYGQQELFFPL